MTADKVAADEKHPIRNGVIIGVSIAAICYAATFIPGFWRWIASRISALWSYLLTPVTVGRWVILLLLLGCIPVCVIVLRAVRRFRGPQSEDYREDRFFGVVWRWDYSFGGPSNIWCFCPQCDTRLVYSEDFHHNRVTFTCELCRQPRHETSGDQQYAIAQIHRQIERKLRNGEWRQMITPKAESK